MASRQIFDPLALLRVSPLVTATCSLWFAWDQHFFLQVFNKPELRARNKDGLLPEYFGYFFPGGVTRVLALLTLTVSASVTNLYTRRSTLEQLGAWNWYLAGASFACAHLLFVPPIAPKVQAIVENKGDSNENLSSWLFLNGTRGLTTDLAAFVSLFVAVSRSVQI